MLPSEIIKKIKKVHIKSGRLVDAMMAGNYRSVFRGTGIEFEEVREYAIGDDVKSIDWNVSARMGRPFVKRYREERELVLMLLVDLSGSMGFGTQTARKRDAAAEAAAILAFNAIRNNDRVGALLFTDQVETYIPPNKGAAHIWRVIREIFTCRPARQGTDIQAALSYLGSVYPKRTIAFLLSDFYAPACLQGLRTVSKKHELIGLMVTDRGDAALPAGGLITLRDMESGEIRRVDAFSPAVRRAFARTARQKEEQARTMLRQANIDCVRIAADRAARDESHVADALAGYFRLREKRLR